MSTPGNDPQPTPPPNRSMFEPNEKRPTWGLSPAEFTKMNCDFCGKPFLADSAGGVSGGLTVLDDNGTRRHYHGYDFQRGNCFEKALKEMDEE